MFSKSNVLFDSKKRVQMLMEKDSDSSTKFKADDFLTIATAGLTFFRFADVREEENEKIAIAEETLSIDKALDRSVVDSNISDILVRTNDDIDQVLADYPDLYDQLSSDDPDQ